MQGLLKPKRELGYHEREARQQLQQHLYNQSHLNSSQLRYQHDDILMGGAECGPTENRSSNSMRSEFLTQNWHNAPRSVRIQQNVAEQLPIRSSSGSDQYPSKDMTPRILNFQNQ